MSDHLLVAAIDFGSTYSSWGFSFKHEYDLKPTKVTAKQWTGLQTAVSLKGPTTILIRPDGETVDSFGLYAETRYAELAEDGKHKEWYFFKRFKMQLFDKIGHRRDFTMKDATGKPLQAKTVFSLSIRYLKDDLMDMSKRQLLDQDLFESDIHWVLTVPFFWNDVAKQFMREAAENAGISSENVTVALESECASLYCQYLPATRYPPGSKYLILDAGGGTVDITVHQIKTDGNLKEIHKATCGYWGGTRVDQCFENFLTQIAGKGVIDKLKDEAMEDYLDLMRSFEVKKREANPSNDRQIYIKLPAAILDEITRQKLEENVCLSRYENKVKVLGDKLKLDPDVMVGFFEETVNCISSHLDSLFKLPLLQDCKTILMVGGFSASFVLKEKLLTHFEDKRVVVLSDAEIAVLKGAVIFGHNPSLIAERVHKYTFGTDMSHEKNEYCTHRETETIVKNGITHCKGIFSVYVRAGDIIIPKEEIYVPIIPTQDSMLINIYYTKERFPELVTDVGCALFEKVSIHLPDTSDGCDREVVASILFGETELWVKVRDKAIGKEYCLSMSVPD